ncbi:MAG: peptidoglycan -binding protein [Rhodobacteraceae bacterium]|nr:peptidoglycan -binding protein [Paracoccaceae bacterium]
MALSRRSGRRFEANIWPGFVDAMTALLLVLIFIISIFMIVQFMLSERIETQNSELGKLSESLNTLALQLGLEQQRGTNLEDKISNLAGLVEKSSKELDKQRTLVASLTSQSEKQKGTIANFEQQVLGLLAQKNNAKLLINSLEKKLIANNSMFEKEVSEKEAIQLTLAQSRQEISEKIETARLAAARREALEVLIKSINSKNLEQRKQISKLDKLKLADAAAAQILREKLKNGNAELTAMSLVLEQKRKEAEETLTLLAATNSVNEDLNLRLVAALTNLKEEKSISLIKGTELREKLVNLLAEKVALEKSVSLKLTDIQRKEILLSEAKVRLQGEKEINIESRLLVESLNQQLAEVRGQLGQLQSLLDASEAKDASEDVEIKNLSSKLNAALARAVSEQRKNSKALEAQNTKLKALALERDSALITLKGEKTKLADFQEKESKRLNSEAAILKERNLVLQTITKERNEALQKLTKEKQLLAELKKKDLERLEAEAKELKKYQSKFFAEIEKALGNQGGIEIKGDRFIFSSEILFGKGKADISKEGLNQIKLVSDIITSISKKIPPEINWVLRVDGHTDNVPLSGLGVFKDNWELSQARALSVVRYMSEELGVPSSRLAATGFGEHQPFDQANTNEARAKNRRIEIKLTER